MCSTRIAAFWHHPEFVLLNEYGHWDTFLPLLDVPRIENWQWQRRRQWQRRNGVQGEACPKRGQSAATQGFEGHGL